MEFIPRPAPPAASPADARRRFIRETGVAAVAAALGIAETAPAHAPADPRMPMPQKAA